MKIVSRNRDGVLRPAVLVRAVDLGRLRDYLRTLARFCGYVADTPDQAEVLAGARILERDLPRALASFVEPIGEVER